MKRKTNKKTTKILSIFVIVCIMVLNLSICSFSASAFGNPKDICHASIEEEFADNRLIVVLDKKTSMKFSEYQTSDFADIKCTKIRDLTKEVGNLVKAKKNNDIDELKKQGGNILDTIRIADNINIYDYRQILCLELEENSKENVLSVIKKIEKRNDVQCACPDYVMHICTTTPNDTLYSNNQSTVCNLIDLPQAWDITTGSTSVMVGVIDTGIDGTHEDLSGVIDVSLSRDFITGSTLPISYSYDYNGHGTKVAGIIGAKGNNNKGICGVCWNVKLVSLICFGNMGEGFSSNAINAVSYATAIGIPILNFSAGWPGDQYYYYNSPMNIIINLYPGLFVCAAGKDGVNNDYSSYYPTNYSLPNLISVASSDINDVKGTMSNYGQTTVDLFAPGENIVTTEMYGTYVTGSGTSMAAPFVTGVAALILSANPTLRACEIKQTILNNVDTVSGLSNYCVTGGRLNAYNALCYVDHHSFHYTNIDLFTGHATTCLSCNKSYTEPHVWVWKPSISAYRCSKCGLISSYIPVVP